jgi:hypothetical protein
MGRPRATARTAHVNRPIEQMSAKQPSKARLPSNLPTEQPSETGLPSNPTRYGHRPTGPSSTSNLARRQSALKESRPSTIKLRRHDGTSPSHVCIVEATKGSLSGTTTDMCPYWLVGLDDPCRRNIRIFTVTRTPDGRTSTHHERWR